MSIVREILIPALVILAVFQLLVLIVPLMFHITVWWFTLWGIKL